MGALDSLSKAIQRFTRGISYVGMFLLIPLMLMTFADVVSRGLFNRPVTGTYELSSYILAVFVLLGVAYTHQVKNHVKVTMFTSRLPKKVQAVLNIVTTLLSIFIIGILAWQGWVVALEETAVSEQLRIPQWPFRLLVSVAAVSLILELIIDIVSDARELAGR